MAAMGAGRRRAVTAMNRNNSHSQLGSKRHLSFQEDDSDNDLESFRDESMTMRNSSGHLSSGSLGRSRHNINKSSRSVRLNAPPQKSSSRNLDAQSPQSQEEEQARLVRSKDTPKKEEEHEEETPLPLQLRKKWWQKIKIPAWYFGMIIFSIPVAIMITLSDPENPQAEAYVWLTGHPLYRNATFQLWHKQQLYAMATLCYSLEFNEWTTTEKGNWLSYDMNECFWWDHPMADTTSATWDDTGMCNEEYHATFLQIHNNENIVNGTIPFELNLLPQLAILELSNLTNYSNPLDYLLPFPDEDNDQTSPFPQLRGLFITQNPKLTGPLPALESLCQDITHLDLHSNAINGTLDMGYLHHLTQLQYLDLSDNQLTGTLPSELGLLTHLTHLDLQSNQLEGTIPRDWQSLTQLSHLDLSSNTLQGAVMTDLGSFTHLQYLSIHSNRVIGTLPSEVGLLTALTVLYTQNTYMTGTIPQELCDPPTVTLIHNVTNAVLTDDDSSSNNIFAVPKSLELFMDCPSSGSNQRSCPQNCTVPLSCTCFQ